MSHQPISLSADLKQLRDEGFSIEIKGNYLLVKDMPYVNSRKEVKYGVLVMELSRAGNKISKPETHVAYFQGEHPHSASGTFLETIKHSSERKEITEGVFIDHSFSCLPFFGRAYDHYYHKVITYEAMISGPAQALEPGVTARRFFPVAENDEQSVFLYVDTASSRANIEAIAAKLKNQKIAIVGVGGTGAYILDLVAKTPVAAIHLYDGDIFAQHNAFRSPGAAPLSELEMRPIKAKYFAEKYSSMHSNVVAHDFIDAGNVNELLEMDFVFICIDRGEARKQIVELLQGNERAFIDVGMGIQVATDKLVGVVRVSTNSPSYRSGRIPFSEGVANDEYNRNIQVADLNSLNAALAVIRWKKTLGFYADFENEHYSTYTVDGNVILNDDLV